MIAKGAAPSRIVLPACAAREGTPQSVREGTGPGNLLPHRANSGETTAVVLLVLSI
jgi:hypothetical protein